MCGAFVVVQEETKWGFNEVGLLLNNANGGTNLLMWSYYKGFYH